MMDRNVDYNTLVRACRTCQLGGLRVARGGLAVPAYPGEDYQPGGLAAISERPGAYEELSGVPFSGPTGDMLDNILADAGVARESLLILNRLACAVPQGEGVQDYPDALANCAVHVESALTIYNPRVVVLLGGPAIQLVFGATARVGETRGMSRTTGGRTYVATYHPAALLRRDVAPEVYGWLVDDWRLAVQRLKEVS